MSLSIKYPRKQIIQNAIKIDTIELFSETSLDFVQSKIEGLREEYQSIADEYNLEMRFGYKGKDVYLQFWRWETDKEYELRKKRIATLAQSRELGRLYKLNQIIGDDNNPIDPIDPEK
jgi:hypothetical protein